MFAKNDKWGFSRRLHGYKLERFSCSTPNTAIDSGIGSMSYRFSVGGELTPNMNNIRNYWSRVTYRVGLYYGADYTETE